jgi:hypothetical protein
MYTPLSMSDAEVEALFDGADGLRADLNDVAEVVATIQAIGRYDADKDFSHLIAEAALESRTTPVARYAAAQAASTSWEWTTRVVPRVAVGAAALLMLVVSSSGLAFAANGAKPGDMLYGLDRAAEVIGIGDGGADERYAEAQALVAAGEMPDGLALASEILDRIPGGEEAKPAVAEAAARLEHEPAGPASQAADQVGALLRIIHDGTIAGVVDIPTVSSLAQKIGRPPGVPPGQTDGAPGGSGEAPGQTGLNPGQSDGEKGPPGQEGTAPGQDLEGAGNSENAPGHDEGATEDATEDAPGNSGDAPGQNKDDDEDTPGNSGDAPGQNKDGEDAPGQDKDDDEDAPGNSGSAPGQGDDNPGQGPEDPPAPPVTTPGQGTPGGRP